MVNFAVFDEAAEYKKALQGRCYSQRASQRQPTPGDWMLFSF